MQSYALEMSSITNNTDSSLFKALKMKFTSFLMACVTFLFGKKPNWFVLKKCVLLRKLRNLECITTF